MKVGVAGLGVIGSVLANALVKANHEVYKSDPAKDFNDDLSRCDALFVCVPVGELGSPSQQDLTHVVEVVAQYATVPLIFIRSTVLPGTCNMLSSAFKANVYSMPEFLTERIAEQSFNEQDIICGSPGGEKEVLLSKTLKELFPLKKIHLMTNKEAETAKYAHNCMGAIKVTYFNIIHQYCEAVGANYDNVRKGFLMSGYINETHTQVPGPDGTLGYGGKCFPLNMNLFTQELKNWLPAYDVLGSTIQANTHIRSLKVPPQ